MLLRPAEHGFNTEISEDAMNNLWLLGALIHGIFSEVIYDLFKQELKNSNVLQPQEENKREILEEYIYDRYRYSRDLPPLRDLSYAYTDSQSG